MSTGTAWRALAPAERLLYLANHYGHPALLAVALGVPDRSLTQVLARVAAGESSKALERSDYIEGLRRARHRMTDSLRRQAVRAQAGRYVAPLMRTPQTQIEPQRYQRTIPFNRHDPKTKYQVVDSFWISYRVEHLPFEQIVEMARQFYALFAETGQFNSWRFEYIAEASVYLSESLVDGRRRAKVFKDENLYRQSLESNIVKLSTHTHPFEEARGNVDMFEDDFRSAWEECLRKGGKRIVDLAFTKFESPGNERVDRLVKKDYLKYKQRVKYASTRRKPRR